MTQWIENLSAMQEMQEGSIPGLRRFPEEGHGNTLEYPYLENPMDRGDWWATVHGAAKSQTRLKHTAQVSANFNNG